MNKKIVQINEKQIMRVVKNVIKEAMAYNDIQGVWREMVEELPEHELKSLLITIGATMDESEMQSLINGIQQNQNMWKNASV